MADLSAVEMPDRVATLSRLLEARKQARRAADAMLVGLLVRDFTNDELRVVADSLAIGETLLLRQLGLLAPDEGFDGRKQPAPTREDNPESKFGAPDLDSGDPNASRKDNNQ